jgi:hypothetical protein
MTEEQRTDYQTKLGSFLPPPFVPPTPEPLTGALLDAPPLPTTVLMPSEITAPATHKIARDQARARALCAAAADVVKAKGGDCSLLEQP